MPASRDIVNIAIRNISATPRTFGWTIVLQNPISSVGATPAWLPGSILLINPSLCDITVANEPIPIISATAIIHQIICLE